MKFQQELASNSYHIHAYTPEQVVVAPPAGQPIPLQSSFLLSREALILLDPCDALDTVSVQAIPRLLAAGHEVNLVALPDEWLRTSQFTLLQQAHRMGHTLEVMSHAAACRTFNVLTQELRQVGLLLIRHTA